MLSCTCDWFIQSLFSDHPRYLSVSYCWNIDMAGPIYIISSWFYPFFYSYFLPFFFSPSGSPLSWTFLIVCSQAVNRQRFIPIFFKYPCFQQKLNLIFQLRTSNLKEIAIWAVLKEQTNKQPNKKTPDKQQRGKEKSPGSSWRGCGDLTCFVYLYVEIYLLCSSWNHFTNLSVDGLNLVL